MTHEELLAKLSPARYIIIEEVVAQLNALRAVVKLHKPNRDECSHCYDYSFDTTAPMLDYPCPTIQAIEKELS